MGKWTRSGRRGFSSLFIILGSSCSVQIFQLFRMNQITPHLLRELPHWGRIMVRDKKPSHADKDGFLLSWRKKLVYRGRNCLLCNQTCKYRRPEVGGVLDVEDASARTAVRAFGSRTAVFVEHPRRGRQTTLLCVICCVMRCFTPTVLCFTAACFVWCTCVWICSACLTTQCDTGHFITV